MSRGLGERGAAAALVVLFLPCLLAAFGLAVDLGVLLVARAELRAAADMGALAAVQDLDYEALAAGEILILDGPAVANASAYVRANLAGLGFLDSGSLEVTVTVLNLDGGSSPRCPVTGRVLEHPTVCVIVRGVVALPFAGGLGPVTVSVHADAAVVGRP